MASAIKLTDKAGNVYFRLQHSRGRGVSPLTRPWHPPIGWSQRAIDRELQKQLRQFEADIQAGLVMSRSERKRAEAEAEAEKLRHPTFQAYVEECFIPRKAPTIAPATLRSYEDNIRLHLLPVFGKSRIDEITAAQISQFSAEISQAYKFSHAQTIFKHLRVILRQAVRDGIIDRNPIDQADSPKRKRTEQEQTGMDKALPEAEAVRLIDCLEQEPLADRAFILLALDSGMRRGELCGLRWEDIDFQSQTVTISRTAVPLSGKGVQTGPPKTSSSRRTVDLGPDVCDLLRQLRQEQARTCISPWIFPARRNPQEPLSPYTADGICKRVARKYGFDGLHLHSLRHTSASLSICNGGDIVSTSKRLGHSTPAITTAIYVHPDQTAIRRTGDTARQALRRAREKDSKRAN